MNNEGLLSFSVVMPEGLEFKVWQCGDGVTWCSNTPVCKLGGRRGTGVLREDAFTTID